MQDVLRYIRCSWHLGPPCADLLHVSAACVTGACTWQRVAGEVQQDHFCLCESVQGALHAVSAAQQRMIMSGCDMQRRPYILQPLSWHFGHFGREPLGRTSSRQHLCQSHQPAVLQHCVCAHVPVCLQTVSQLLLYIAASRCPVCLRNGMRANNELPTETA